MNYIIDANNLAGKLGLLKEKDFDLTIINILKQFFAGNKCRIMVVFDGGDEWGDSREEGNFTYFYAPCEKRKGNADKKILELAKKFKNINLVTDDRELQEKTRKLSDNINIINSRDLAGKITKNIPSYEEEKWSNGEIRELNRELLKNFGL